MQILFLRVVWRFAEQNFCDESVEDDVKVLPVECRLQECFGRAEPFPVFDCRLKVRKSEVVFAVDVEDLVAAVVDRVEEGVRQRSPVGRSADRKQSSGRMVPRVLGQLKVLLIFRFFEKGQNVFETPTGVTLSVPLVVVLPAASDVEHSVDHGRAADHLAAVPSARVPVHCQTRFAVRLCSENRKLKTVN